MKVLVVNGSPRGKQGNTEFLIKAFTEGLQESNAIVEEIYLKDKQIEHCIGCFVCWEKTPGICVHKDDMQELLAKVQDADMLILGTPLYVFTVSGMMKDFMDRLIPLVQPFMEVKNGLSTHPSRHGNSPRSLVLISNSGFPEPEHFSGLKETFRCWYRNDKRPIGGMICCAAGVLLGTPGLQDTFGWYLDATRQAGREVANDGQISAETQAILDRPLMEDQALYAKMANAYWESIGLSRTDVASNDAEQTQTVERSSAEPLPLPTSLETMQDLVAGMAASLDPVAAGKLNAVLQFVVSNEDPGRYYLEIADGQCAAYAGEHRAPTATVTTPAEVWLAIARGELNGTTAFMTGRYKVSGDLQLLMRLEKLFPTKA